MNASQDLSAIVEGQRLPRPRDARRQRERAGLTQAQLAAYLGVSRPTVTRWELGDRSPRGELRTAYKRALDELRGAR